MSLGDFVPPRYKIGMACSHTDFDTPRLRTAQAAVEQWP